jgi:hypothetical protein
MPKIPRHLSQIGASFLIVAAAWVVVPDAAAAQDDFSMPGFDGGMSGFDFDSARMSFFNQADINGDFALSRTERAQAMAHGDTRLFEGSDTNADGMISLDEYIEYGNQLFGSLDADGDGALGPGEM